MQKEVITVKQGVTLIILFVMGSAVIIIPGLQARRDVWLAVLLAAILALPVVIMYARLLYLFPESDLFDILQSIFGKTIGKAVSIMFIWFAFHLGTLVLYNFGTFIKTVGLAQTPMIVPMSCIAILCAWGVKEGIETLGRCGELFLPVIIVSFISCFLLLIPEMDINRIKPILYNGIEPLLKGAFSSFSFPFAETVIFTMTIDSLKDRKSPFKVYSVGIILSGIMGMMITLMIMLAIGENIVCGMYFPAYIAISRISIANFVQRLEIVISIVFLFTGFIKISICLLAACNGVSKFFSLKNYRSVVTPIVLLMLALANFIYSSIQESYEWASNIWPYYAFVFQVILPVIIWIAAEIKKRVKMV